MKNRLLILIMFSFLFIQPDPVYCSGRDLVINILDPMQGNVQINEPESQLFIFSGYDDDGDNLYFYWELDSLMVSTDSSYTFISDYTSAGNYDLTLSVRDTLISLPDTTFFWSIEVIDVDQIIVVDSLYPAEGSYQILELDMIEFYFSGFDPDGNSLNYSWLLDSLEVSVDSSYTYITDNSSPGLHEIHLSVNDNFTRNDTIFNWQIEVLDLDQVIVVDSLFPTPGTLEIVETDSLGFLFSGYDPDGNTLEYNWNIDTVIVSTDSTYSFIADYHSAGTHDLVLSVTDNYTRNDTSFTWLINVADVDQLIVVDSLYPLPDTLFITEFEDIHFVFSGFDPDGNNLDYSWELDSLLVSTDSTYSFVTDQNSSGSYSLILEIDDGFPGRNSILFSWIISVENVSRILVPENFSTIQSAIDVSVDGDTVQVSPGIYAENISFNGKKIKVSSTFSLTRDPAVIDSTVIDGSGLTSVVSFDSGEDSTSVLEGFTIRNGNASNGGGISCSSASPVLSSLKIENNTAASRGGGIYCLNSNTTINDCEISNNIAFIGAGAEFYNSNCTITNSTFFSNTASFIGGGLECYNSHLEIVNTLIINNTGIDLDGGGIAGYNNSTINVTHSVLTGNEANYGGGISLHNTFFSLNNSIVSYNTNYGLYFENGTLVISYSNFWENTIDNFYNCGAEIGANVEVNSNGDSCDAYYNIQLEPNFTDYSAGIFTLNDYSLCIGAGDSTGYPVFDKIYNTRPFPVDSQPDLGIYENILGTPIDAVPEIIEEFPLSDSLFIFETDSLNFFVSAYDPNGRELFYSWELDSIEVCTDSSYIYYSNHFSAGVHSLNLLISDQTNFSRAEIFATWIIDVQDVDQEIIVNAITPAPGETTISESDSINFNFSGFDPDLNDLTFSWIKDSQEVSIDSSYIFQSDFTSAGSYDLSLTVSDGFSGRNTLIYDWNITVENVSTFHVPEIVSTIQGAINVAVEGDTVIVHPGNYIENINLLGKRITLGSLFFTTNDSSYISQTIINGSSQSNNSLVTFTGLEDSTTVLTGFKLINGAGYNGEGGGIRCASGSSPILMNLIITQNSSYTGGGIYCENGSEPVFINCKIVNNIAFNGGGASCASNSNPKFINCLFYNNTALANGGAIEVNNATPEFIHNTITGNHSETGSAFYLLNNAEPFIINSIIWDNFPNEVTVLDTLSDLIISYSIIKDGWEGPGNMNIDPLFNDAQNGDFTNSNFSYAIGNGNASAMIFQDIDRNIRPDPPGSDPDLGIYENSLSVPVDGPIIINEIFPSPGPVILDETESVEFFTIAYDYNGAPLEYRWELDFIEVCSDSNYIFETDLSSAGDYFLMLTIMDNYNFRSGERSQTGFTWSITVNDATLPEPPANVTVISVGDSILISWDPVIDATSYKVYSSGDPQGVFLEDTGGVLSGESWSALISSSRKFFRISAVK